jgi:hypothetical protein
MRMPARVAKNKDYVQRKSEKKCRFFAGLETLKMRGKAVGEGLWRAWMSMHTCMQDVEKD